MFTVLLTLIGLVVFVVSCFTVGFKAGWKRLMLFTVTGLIIDVLLTVLYWGTILFLL